MHIIEVQQVEKRYPGSSVPALRGLDLFVEAGEFFGLLGPNGAGKTTLLSILCGLRKATGGRVILAGEDVTRNPAPIRSRIGLVPQDIALYPSLTAFENLAFFGRMYGLAGAALRARVQECLAMVGLENHAGRRVETYSGGMKRRANLAAGLLHHPPILILDEPTVGIDAQSRNLIFQNLRALNQAGMTLVYATHYMEEAEQFCGRVAILDEGRCLTQGSPAALIAAQPGCPNLDHLFLELTGKRLRD